MAHNRKPTPTKTVQEFIATSPEIRKLKELIEGIKDADARKVLQTFIAEVNQAQTYDALFKAIPNVAYEEIHGESTINMMRAFSFTAGLMPGITPDQLATFKIMPQIISLQVDLYKIVVPLTSYAEKEHVMTCLSDSTTYKKLKEFCEAQYKNNDDNYNNPNFYTIMNNNELASEIKKVNTFTELLDLLGKYNFNYYQQLTGFSLFKPTNPKELLDEFRNKVTNKMTGLGYSYTNSSSSLRGPSLNKTDNDS